MKAILTLAGYVIGGPKRTSFVASSDEIDRKIADMLALDKEVYGVEYDRDDYTTTEVWAKTWVGAILGEDGQPTQPNPMSDDWDTVYAAQVIKATLEAVENLGEAQS